MNKMQQFQMRKQSVLSYITNHGPVTRQDIERFTGADRTAIQLVTGQLHREGAIRIGGWLWVCKKQTMQYVAADGQPDAPRPRAMPVHLQNRADYTEEEQRRPNIPHGQLLAMVRMPVGQFLCAVVQIMRGDHHGMA